MFEYSHYIEKKYPPPKNTTRPKPADDDLSTNTATLPGSTASTLGNILFNDYRSEALATQIMDVKLKAEGLQKERDFYYNKLRDIETFCRVMEDGYQDPTTTRILALIYESQEVRKVKKKRARGGRKKKNPGSNNELEDFPLAEYNTASASPGTSQA